MNVIETPANSRCGDRLTSVGHRSSSLRCIFGMTSTESMNSSWNDCLNYSKNDDGELASQKKTGKKDSDLRNTIEHNTYVNSLPPRILHQRPPSLRFVYKKSKSVDDATINFEDDNDVEDDIPTSSSRILDRRNLVNSMGTSLRTIVSSRRRMNNPTISVKPPESPEKTQVSQGQETIRLEMEQLQESNLFYFDKIERVPQYEHIFLDFLNKEIPAQGKSSFTSDLRRIEWFKELIKEKPHLCKRKFKFDAFKDTELFPLHMLCALNAPISCIKQCYLAHTDAIIDKSSSLGTPIHYACYYGSSVDIIFFLLSKDPRCLAISNTEGQSPFMVSCMNPFSKDCLEIIQLLSLLSFRSPNQTDKMGNNVLHLLCSMYDSSCKMSLKLLEKLVETLPKACVFATNKDGSTPLHLALSNHHVDHLLIKFLTKLSPVPIFICDKIHGYSPIHVAIKSFSDAFDKGKERIIYYLAKKYPHSLAVKSLTQQTPLDLAKELGLSPKIVKSLKY